MSDKHIGWMGLHAMCDPYSWEAVLQYGGGGSGGSSAADHVGRLPGLCLQMGHEHSQRQENLHEIGKTLASLVNPCLQGGVNGEAVMNSALLHPPAKQSCLGDGCIVGQLVSFEPKSNLTHGALHGVTAVNYVASHLKKEEEKKKEKYVLIVCF